MPNGTHPQPKFLVASINFYCDLASATGDVIKLGTVGELVLPELYVFGLIARTSLTAHEAGLLGDLGKKILLPSPFIYLASQVEEALQHTGPGEAIAYLAHRHSLALHFEQPRQLAIPKPSPRRRPSVRPNAMTTVIDQLAPTVTQMPQESLLRVS